MVAERLQRLVREDCVGERLTVSVGVAVICLLCAGCAAALDDPKLQQANLLRTEVTAAEFQHVRERYWKELDIDVEHARIIPLEILERQTRFLTFSDGPGAGVEVIAALTTRHPLAVFSHGPHQGWEVGFFVTKLPLRWCDHTLEPGGYEVSLIGVLNESGDLLAEEVLLGPEGLGVRLREPDRVPRSVGSIEMTVVRSEKELYLNLEQACAATAEE